MGLFIKSRRDMDPGSGLLKTEYRKRANRVFVIVKESQDTQRVSGPEALNIYPVFFFFDERLHD